MTERWTVIPINEDGYEGWDINYLNQNLSDRLIASVPSNSEQSIKDALLISMAPELLDICKKCLSVVNDLELKNELEKVINNSELIKEDLMLPAKIMDDIFTIDIEDDTFRYIPEAPINQFILFEPFYNLNTGSIKLNISEESIVEPLENQIYYSRPINYIMSKKNAKAFISMMDEKYKTLGNLVDFSSKDNKNLLEVILDEFDSFAEKYKTVTSLSKYLDKYPLVTNSEYEETNELFKCPRSIHSVIKIVNENKTIEGTLYLKEKTNSLVVYNSKNMQFHMIKNSPEILDNITAEYIDLIDFPLVKK